MNVLQEINTLDGNNDPVIADTVKQSNEFLAQFKAGQLTEDEYRDLMRDLKNTFDINSLASDLALKNQLGALLDQAILLGQNLLTL